MSTRRARYLAFEALSEGAQHIVVAAIDANATQEEIRRRVEQKTGESFSKGACSRFVRSWHIAREQEKAADKQTVRLVRALKEEDVETEELARMVVKLGLFENMDEAGELPLKELMALQLRQKELRLKEQSLAQGAEKIRLLERDLGLREKKLKQIREQAKQAEKAVAKLTDLPPKVIRDIKSLYGLASEEIAA